MSSKTSTESKKTEEKQTSETATKKAENAKKVNVGAYYSELVSVKLFKDNNRYKDDVFVAVNGVGMIVPRGVEVKIPRKYAIALANSEKQASFAGEYQSKVQNNSSAEL